MFKKVLVVSLFLIAFYLSSGSFYSISEQRNLLVVIGLTVFFGILLTPSIVKNETKDVEIIDREWEEGDYHNEFGRVGCASDYGATSKFNTCGGGSCSTSKSKKSS